jgi:hypothetical protein
MTGVSRIQLPRPAPKLRRASRRTFLRGLGMGGALAPFLPLLNASGAEERPLRLILWFTPHGTLHDQWQPSGTETNFDFSPILKPLERHRDKLTILDGLDIQADGVGAPHTKGPALLYTASPLSDDMTFTRQEDSGTTYYGWNTAPSVDQFILSQLSPTTPYGSLEFGVRSGGNNPGSRIIYSAAATPLAPEADPWAALGRLLGDLGQSSSERAALRARKKSALDLVSSELSELQAKIPAADRAKVDAHLSAIRSIESSLDTDVSGCSSPDLGTAVDADLADNTPVVFERLLDVMAASLACDLTRVMSMQYRVGENDGGYTYDWLGITDQEHHLLTHSSDDDAHANDELTKIYTWYADRFAYFLDQLDAIPEGDGTMLDNCLVVWGSELGKGNNHSFERVPFVLAGGAAGQLTGGRYLTFDGVPHNRLLVSVCNLMGLTGVQTFGTTDQGRGPLSGLV